MSVTLFLLMGILGVLLILLMKRPIIARIGDNTKWVHKLKQAKWFQNHWYAGLFLFTMNAVLFISTGLLLYMSMYFDVPFIHLLVITFAVIGSFLLWGIVHKAWQSTNKDRLKMATVGSGFYVIVYCCFHVLVCGH